MTTARAIAQALRRLEYLERIRAIMAELYETVDDPAFNVRRTEVVAHVAAGLKALGERVTVNNRFHRLVFDEAIEMGWTPIRNGNRRLFRGVKPKGIRRSEALAISQRNRHKMERRE